MSGSVYLLGPQRPTPNLPALLAEVSGSGRVIYITAGWRHEETDDEALQRDVGPLGQLLPLYAWFEDLARSAPDLFRVYHEKQQEIRHLKSLYRLRLDPAVEAVRVLLEQLEKNPDSEFLLWEIEDALGVLRGLRERFVSQCDAVRARFDEQHRPYEHPRIQRRMEQIATVIGEAKAVLIAGGHVGVLRNRLEFFGLGKLLADAVERGATVFAWSAGAMALTEKVVLFHDDPPMGQLNAEVLDRGLGLAKGIVALPHARQRLSLDDTTRVAMLAARFHPDPCIGLENGACLVRRGDRWANIGNHESAQLLRRDGTVVPLEAEHATGP